MSNEAQWLEARTKGIGGSDVAAILGLSPWKSAFQVWEEKLHLREGSAKTPEMTYGLMMEPVIRQWYSDHTGRAVRLPEKILQHSKHLFMLANLDGVTDDQRVVEIKTARSSQEWGEPETDEIPMYYRTQVEHYLIVTGFPVADVVVSFAGTMPVLYTVEADHELQEMLIDREADFWHLVETKTPPEPVTYSDMVARFRKSRGELVVANDEVIDALQTLKLIKTRMKALEVDEEQAKTIIMGYMKDRDTLVDLDERILATWKTSKGIRRFDKKSFEVDYPGIYDRYFRESEPSRRFLLK
jgi:putative phage-type endonuclease